MRLTWKREEEESAHTCARRARWIQPPRTHRSPFHLPPSGRNTSTRTTHTQPHSAASIMSVSKKNIDRNHTGAGTGTEIQLVRNDTQTDDQPPRQTTPRTGAQGSNRWRWSRARRQPEMTTLACDTLAMCSTRVGLTVARCQCCTALPPARLLVCLCVQLSNAENSVATLVMLGEDHTLGNSFRYVLAKNKEVDFVGYSIPHPSEMKLNMRIQTKSQFATPRATPHRTAPRSACCSHSRHSAHATFA